MRPAYDKRAPIVLLAKQNYSGLLYKTRAGRFRQQGGWLDIYSSIHIFLISSQKYNSLTDKT